MDLQALLREQRLNRFKDVAGAHADVAVPLSDRLASRLVTESLPEDGPVREVDLEAHTGNMFIARLKLTRPAFLPSVSVKLFIERQPHLPDSPVFVLRLEMAAGLMGLAGPAIRMMATLPPGLQLEGDRLEVDLRRVLDGFNAPDALQYVDAFELTTDDGRFVITARLSVATIPSSGLLL